MRLLRYHHKNTSLTVGTGRQRYDGEAVKGATHSDLIGGWGYHRGVRGMSDEIGRGGQTKYPE